MHEEFCRWFDPECAGTPQRYTAVATALWEQLQQSKPK